MVSETESLRRQATQPNAFAYRQCQVRWPWPTHSVMHSPQLFSSPTVRTSTYDLRRTSETTSYVRAYASETRRPPRSTLVPNRKHHQKVRTRLSMGSHAFHHDAGNNLFNYFMLISLQLACVVAAPLHHDPSSPGVQTRIKTCNCTN